MPNDIDYTNQLKRFCGPNEEEARSALSCLEPSARLYLQKVLGSIQSPNTREDLIQEALVKAWDKRNRFKSYQRKAWFGWVATIARNLVADQVRSKPSKLEEPISDNEVESGPSFVDHFINELTAEELFALADEIWLNLDPACIPEHRNRCLLAIQLYYFEGWQLEEVLDHFTDVYSDNRLITRADIDTWLENPANLRLAAYHELLFPPDRLTIHLLDLPTGTSRHDLDDLLLNSETRNVVCEQANSRWTDLNFEAILWLYFRCATVNETVNCMNNRISAEEIEDLRVRSKYHYPFIDQCRKICRWLDTVDISGSSPENLIGEKSRIWERLTFEYRYRYSLPGSDVYDRVSPTADVLKYSISSDTINSWTSGGRLLNRLKRAYHKLDVEQNNE